MQHENNTNSAQNYWCEIMLAKVETKTSGNFYDTQYSNL